MILKRKTVYLEKFLEERSTLKVVDFQNNFKHNLWQAKLIFEIIWISKQANILKLLEKSKI